MGRPANCKEWIVVSVLVSPLVMEGAVSDYAVVLWYSAAADASYGLCEFRLRKLRCEGKTWRKEGMSICSRRVCSPRWWAARQVLARTLSHSKSGRAGQQLRSSKLQCSAAALTKHSRQPVFGRSVCFGGPSGQGPGRGTAKSAAARQCSRYRGLRSRDRIRVMELVSKTAVGVRDEAQAELPCPVLQVTATEGSSKR